MTMMRGGFGGERSREQVQGCLETVRGLCGAGRRCEGLGVLWLRIEA